MLQTRSSSSSSYPVPTMPGSRHVSRQEWFQAYASAMLEGNPQTVKHRIEAARAAIIQRLATLNAGESPVHLEFRDLKNALGKLDLLELYPAV